MRHILLTGGGTAGHILPNIALLPELKKHFNLISYIGGFNSKEEIIAKQHKLPFYATQTIKFNRSKIFSNFKIPFILSKAVKEAKVILQKIKPDVIFAKGGYVSLPCCIAGRKLNIPIICHESDATLGLANKYIARFAKKVILSQPLKKAKEKYVLIGNPIRENIFKGNKDVVIKQLNIKNLNLPYLLIVGGSMGAVSINNFIFSIVEKLSVQFNIIHILGKNSKIINFFNYYPIEYAENINDFYALSDIVISRAGAGACAEIDALNKKSILIPLENKSSRGDQLANAEIMRDKGSIIIREHTLNYETFKNAINTLSLSQNAKKIMKNDTNSRIVNEIISV